MSRPAFGVNLGVWTLGDQPETVLDRLLGTVGCDYLTLTVVTGPRVTLAAGAPHAPHLFHTRGGWHYASKAEAAGGALRARIAKWAGKRDRLGAAARWAERHAVQLRFQLALRHAEPLLDAYPRLIARNAWDEENALAGACVLQPDLRALLQASLDELAAYQPQAVRLAGWTVDPPPLEALRGGLRHLPPVAANLSNWCFCSACREVSTAAGVDADAAARSAQQHLARCARDASEPAHAALRADELLQAYADARYAAARQWLRGLAETHGSVPLHVEQPEREHDDLATPPLQITKPRAHRRELPDAPEPETTPVFDLRRVPLRDLEEDDLRPIAERPPAPGGVLFPLWRPWVERYDDLVRGVRLATETGVSSCELDGLDQAPAETVTWLHKALRYGRRE